MSNLNSPVNQEAAKTTSETNASFLRAARAGNLDKVLEYLKENIDINTSNSNGLNALHLASKEGHVHVVDELLKQKADVNAATKKGNTALHIASLAGQQSVVELLVKSGANVDCRSQNGFTPLYMAAQENHLEVVRFLLANSANQSLATEDGFTPLAVALQQGHEKVVALLLENDSRGKIRLPALHIAAKKNDVKAAALLLSNDPNMDLSPEARMVNCTTKAGKSGFTPLHIAAHYGNVEIAKYLISKGANVNYEARQNITPLHVATKWGKGNSVNLLLENGAKIDAKTRDGLTPLHCAARSGHEEVVELLIAKQAPINAKTKNGLTALHMAAQGDHVEAARILLYHSPKLVDQTTCDFLTALHVAAHCGHVKIAKLLIDHKADVNSRALNGFTPLHIACKKNRIKVIELLIKHGASKEATTESGLTPLHVASFMGCMNVVVFLIQHGSLPNVPTIRGETPLHLAARANQTDIVRILLRHGASVDAKAKEQQTPLHIATRLGNTDIIALLLRHGAFVDAPTSDGYTPLHIASKEGQEEVASILFENGASLNVTTKKGFTPLHIAAKYGNIKVASLLLQRDAQPDIQGKNGLTPLHVATHYNRPSLAHLLLQHNASPHIVAKNGYSALHIAAKKNQLDIATTLLEYNAHTNCESNAGFTPLHLACQEGHLDMASLLLDHKAEPGASSKNGLTPLHLCAQEDKVNCAAVLVKMNAAIDPQTKAGYTPLHVACHFGQINMVKFLLGHMADVNIITKHGFTALHCAAQQGHVLIVKLLLEHGASPDITNNNGQTPLAIAQRLGYISVIEELRQVTQTTLVSTTIKTTEEKYKVQTPETMQETFMSDSEDEMGDEAMFGDAEHYKYLTNEADLNNAADDSIALTPKTPKRDDSTKLPSPQTPILNADLDLVVNQDENHINEHELRPESPNIQQAKSQPEKFIANSLGNMSMAESMDGSFYNGYASSKHVNLLNETDNIPIESKPKSTGLHLNSFTNLTSSYQKSIDFSVFSSHADNLNSSGAHFNAHVKDFLISFMVDARGGAMKGCRHSGVRVIIPPKRASMPTRITCRFVRKEKLAVAPPLNESESLAARVLEMGPQGCKFLGPVVLEIPHYASLRGREREIVVLRSDAGEKWHEHPIVASESAVEEALGCTLELLSAQSLEPDAANQQSAHDDSLSQVSSISRLRITRIITHDFPKYFALVSRVRHETHAVSESGGVISSTIVPKAQAVFPEKALQKKIKLSLQAMPIAHDLVCKMFGNRVVVSPIVTIEPRRRKFHKAITLTIPLPKSPFKGMLNSYSHTNDSYSLRLLCSITGGLAPAQWEDITGHTPLSYIDECVSFTTTVSARFWLMDCQNVAEATKMATELYREAIAVPFMARFVVYAKRHEHTEAKLRVYCITDDKEEKTLEQREAFVVVAKSKEVEVLDNRVQWLEMSGNIAPVTLNKSSVNCALSASADQLNMSFVSFYENRLPFTVRIKDAEQSAVNGRLVFLKDSRTTLTKLDAATRSQPVCTLDIQLPSYDREQIEHDESKKRATLERGQLSLRSILNDSSATLLSQGSACRHTGHVTGFNLRLLANDLSNLVDAFDWVNLAKLLELTEHDIEQIKKLSSNSPNLLSASLANQTYDMLVYFVHKFDEQAHDQYAASFGHVLSKALQEMGVEADLVERNSYTLSGLLPQSAENIFSVEKSLNNKLNERGEHHHGQGQLESSISQLKEAVDLYNNHEDRDIMKESESAQNSDNENEHDLVHNLPKENQIELSSLINQIDKQMDELERDNEHGDDLVSTVIIGEEHMDKKENGYVAKTIVDTVIQGISAKQFDNFNQHIEEVTQVTSLVEDKQETSDNEAMRHSNSDPEYAHKINAEYEAIKRNILSRTGDNEILVRSPTVPKSSKKLDKVIDSHLSSLIPPLDQSSNLNSSYYDNLDHSDSDFTCNRKIDPFLHDHEQMSTLDEDDSESVMNKSNTSELLNDIIQHVMIAEDQAEQLNKLDTDDEFTWQNLVLSHSSNLNSDDDEDKLSIKDLIQESVINQQNQLEEVEQAIRRDEDYYHDDDDDDDDDEDEYDDNYDHDPDSGRNNLNDDKNADCEQIFIKLDRSQLREFEFNSYDFDSNENSKFQNIEQQSPIIEQELMTTGQELENLKQRLVMSESVSEVTQNVLDSIRKEYSIEEKSYAEEIDPSQCIDPMVQQVIENLAKESASEMEKIIMVEPFDNEVVYDSDSDEIDEFVKNENDDDGKDCLLESSSSEMSSLKNKIQAEHHENQDTELDQDSAWYHHTDQNESENLMEKLSLTKQYQTFESSSSSSLNDDTDQKEKSAANVQVRGAEDNNDNSVSIVIHGSTSSTADENDIKLDRSNLTIDLIKVSESREKLIENDHLQRVESSYDICSYANEQLVVGQSTDDISAANTIIEQQRFTPNCEAYYISSEAEVTDDENKIELENSNVFLDIPIQKVINQSESSEPLILGEQVDQEVISNSSASVNSINSSTNSSSHYSLTTSDENMAKNLLDNENNESKSSSSSINFDDSNRKNISKSLNFLESLVVPSNVDPNEQIEEYTILLERQNELNKTHLIEHETFKNIKSDPSSMKTSLSLNFNKKSNKQIKIERPKEINFISTDFSDDYYNKECFDHQTPTPVENTAGSFFDKRITSSNEPSIDMFDKASSTDNSEKVDLNLEDCVVENLINQLSDPEHAEEEVAAAFATAYLFSSNVNSQSNEELKSQIDIASEEEAYGPNRFFGIDNEAYASSKSSRESVIINYEYDDTDDQQQMKIKIIQATNPSKSIICSSYGPQNLDESNESFENNIHELNEINQDVTDDIIIHQDELEQTLNRTPNIELDRNDDENILTNESSIEYDDLIEKVSNISENYYNQDKEPLLSDDYVEIFENIQEKQAMILHPIEVTDVDKKLIDDSNLSSSSKMEELNLNIVTEEGVELDDQSFLISTPTNEIQAIQNDDSEFINYSDIAKHLVGKTINDSIEKILIENLNQNVKEDYTEFNEIKKSPINIDDELNDSQNNEQNEISSLQQSHTSMNDDERKLNPYAIQSSDSEKNFIIINEAQTESNDKHNLEENIFGLYTPLVVLEHVSSEPNSDQEFDPEACIENSISHEICIETIEKNNQELAKQIVDSIITNSIEKLNQIPDDPEKTDLINLSIIKGKSEHNFDNSNQLNLKEVRFNTNVITSSQDTSIDCFDNELLNLQQIILNSNFENTFNQINKLNCQNSDLICSPKELAKIIEDKFEDDQLTELDYSDHLIYIEAKKICDFVIDKAIKSIISISIEKDDLNENSYKLKYEEEEKQTEKKIDKTQNSTLHCFLENEPLKDNSNLDFDEMRNYDAQIINSESNATFESELISSQSFDALDECQLLENMKKPLLTSSFISDTLPSDSENDPASYHTALSGLNESKNVFSSSNYLTAHDDQDSNSQHQISASDSFYSANSKLKSLNSSNFSSYSNANNSYNNLDESYSTLNDTNNCSDFEHTIISESNDESKYEDVQSFIKDMQPLIETNLEANIVDNEKTLEPTINFSPNQDSVTSSSSSVASIENKSLSANTISTSMINTSSPSSSIEINKQLEQADNESCTSSVLEFEKIEEQCMDNTDDSSRIDSKNEIKDETYSFFESTAILSNDLNTIYETNEKESSSATSSPLSKSDLKLEANQLETTLIKNDEANDVNQIDLTIDLSKSNQNPKNQSASATTSPIQSPTCYRPKNIGSTSSLTKQVLQIQQLSSSRSSSSSSIKSTDSFENELKTKVKIDDNSYFAKIRQNTPPLIETKNESSDLLDTPYNIRKKASKRTSRTSSSTSSTSSTSVHGENICNKLSILNASMGTEASVLTSSSSSNLKQSVLTAEDLPSFKKSALSSEQNSSKVTSSVSSSNISSDPSKTPSLNQNLSQSANLEKKDEIHRSSSSHSHHSSDCYCGKSSPSLISTTNMSTTNNPTSSSSCFSFTTQGNDLQSNIDEKQLNVNVPSDSTSS